MRDTLQMVSKAELALLFVARNDFGLHLQLQNGQPGGWGVEEEGWGHLSRVVGGGCVDRQSQTGRPLGAGRWVCLLPAGVSTLATFSCILLLPGPTQTVSEPHAHGTTSCSAPCRG